MILKPKSRVGNYWHTRAMPKIFMFCFTALLVAVQVGEADAPQPGEPHLQQAGPGEYQHLWLTFGKEEDAPKAFVGLRAGKSTTVWFIGGAVPGGVKKSGAYRVLIDGHDLALVDGKLKGKIMVRQVSIWAPMALLGQVTLHLDAKASTQGITGTWTAELAEGKMAKGSVSGSLTDEATIRAEQSFAPGANWPSYHGPHRTNQAATTATTLIDDLTKAQPVWRAELSLLSGWGTGVDSRYSWRAGVGTVCGGSSTPVYADGRIYLFHYVPAGDPDAKLLEKVLADFEKSFKRKPTAIERQGLVDFCRPYSDTIVTCLDAQTGALIWRVTFPRLSGNYQTHKWRGLNPTACVIGPVVIANDLANNWVALDAIKGDVLWTIKRSQKVESNRAAVGAVKAGSLAILPTNGSDPVKAVDPKTGKVVWQQPGGPQVLVWGKPGQERVVFLNRLAPPTCHDAATGKLLWKMEERLIGESGSSALIDGDILVGHILPDPKKRGGHFQGWKLSNSGTTKLWQDEFLPFDENLTVTLGNGKAYLVGQNEIRCLDITTGKLLGKQVFDGKMNAIGSNQWLGLMGDKLLLSPEGQHGTQSLQLLDAGSLKLLGGRWFLPNNSTTAYAVHSIGWPVVDGRIFVRGMDGLYCYDLRENKHAASKQK